MLILEDLLEKMKEHFPRWMDIRRKVKSSNGGQYLAAIAEEITDLNEAIEEYKRDFFIDRYIEKEDDVLTYLYKVNTGKININSIKILEPAFELTEDNNIFYQESDYAFYQDGFVYFKQEFKEVKYAIDGFTITTSSEKIHVWNIFDEFAAFIGLRRYLWESNKELLNRVLATANNKPNSSEDGLKNAILNNLINIAPELSKENILIERPTPENLIKYYDEFENILDHLMTVNRDVYRTKRWDLDPWNFEIKSIDYIPHAWDVILSEFNNGVGFKDDLKVEIVNSDTTTDADVFFYKKTVEAVDTYIKNNNIKESVTLDLLKYDNDLKPANVKYEVTASEINSLDPSQIVFELYDNKTGKIEKHIDDLFNRDSNEFSGIRIVDNTILNKNSKYQMILTSKSSIGDLAIRKCKLISGDPDDLTYEDLLVYGTPGFEPLGLEGVRNNLCKKHITEKYQFSEITNAIKENDGFVIANISEEASMKVNINGCANEPLYYEYTCEQLPVLYNNIKKENCYVSEDAIITDTVDGDKYVDIEIEANSFSADIFGAYKIIYSINGENVRTQESAKEDTHYIFSLGKFDTPQVFNIKIYLKPKAGKIGRIRNIMFSKYEFNIKTEQGEISSVGGVTQTPNYDDNSIVVTMRTYTGFSPVLKYIYVGRLLINVQYTTKEFSTDILNTIDMDYDNAVVTLQELNEENQIIRVVDNYKPCKIYKAENNHAYLELDLSGFKDIENIEVDRCKIETTNYGDNIQYLLNIPSGVEVSTVVINGTCDSIIDKQSLESILTKKSFYSAQNCKVNVSRISNSLIIEKEGNPTIYYDITRDDICNGRNAGLIKVISNEEDNISCIFIEKEDDQSKVTTVSNSFEGYFDTIALFPIDSKIYTAINETNVIMPYTTDIQIVNTFNNNFLCDREDGYFYIVKSLNESYEVKFIPNILGMSGEELFSIADYRGSKFTRIVIKKASLNSNDNYSKQIVTIKHESLLGNTIPLNDYYILSNKDRIEIAKYIITNEDVNIVYKNKNEDPDNADDYIYSEVIYTNFAMFNKLNFCRIKEIEYISLQDFGSQKGQLVEGKDYTLLKKEGIIIWHSYNICKESTQVYIKYNYEKPVAIKYSLDSLYKKINYVIDAFTEKSTIHLENIKSNQAINMNLYKDYLGSDMVSIKCSNIGFVAELKRDFITFKKDVKTNTVAVKSGYYYLDGDEYYLFANEYFNNIEQIDDINFVNVVKENKQLTFKQKTSNYIKNSIFKRNSLGQMFLLDCEDKNYNGISRLNSITACNSYNHWNTFGVDMNIVKGLNGSGIKFVSSKEINGYAYLNINKYVEDNKRYVISFYMKGSKCEAYLGKERMIYSSNGDFNKQSIIDLVSKANESLIEDSIYELKFTNEKDNNYFLIIKGDAVVDDIVIQEESNYELGVHNKNIGYLNLNIEESIYADFKTRLYLDDHVGAIYDGTEVSKENNIINSSYIQWGFTKIKEICSYTDWTKCVLKNVGFVQHNDKCLVKTETKKGSVFTDPIYIGNVSIIKNFVFKINDVLFNDMKGFSVKLYTADSPNSGYRLLSTHTENIGAINGDNLSSYVKLLVEMPSNKVINNIELFVEYLSNEVASPADMSVINGLYTTGVLDSQYTARYVVNDLKYEDLNTDLSNVVFEVRASRENSENATWTTWKQIRFDDKGKVYNRIVFDGYKYFQVRTSLKGSDTEIKIKHLDLEVI